MKGLLFYELFLLSKQRRMKEIFVYSHGFGLLSKNTCVPIIVNKQCSAIPQEARCDMQIANMLSSSTEFSNESTTKLFQHQWDFAALTVKQYILAVLFYKGKMQ